MVGTGSDYERTAASRYWLVALDMSNAYKYKTYRFISVIDPTIILALADGSYYRYIVGHDDDRSTGTNWYKLY